MIVRVTLTGISRNGRDTVLYTLCWDCAKATDGGCTWSEKHEPVDGWDADETGNGYMVGRCPEFERITWGYGFYRTWDEYIDTIERRREKHMNKLFIIGNLTKDPELRATQDGTKVCGFTVAVNRPKSTRNPDPGAEFFNCNAWRTQGETCAKYLTKGSKVAVTGRVSLRTWAKEDRSGASLEVLVDEIEFLPTRKPDATAPVDPESGFQQVDPDGLPF